MLDLTRIHSIALFPKRDTSSMKNTDVDRDIEGDGDEDVFDKELYLQMKRRLLSIMYQIFIN